MKRILFALIATVLAVGTINAQANQAFKNAAKGKASTTTTKVGNKQASSKAEKAAPKAESKAAPTRSQTAKAFKSSAQPEPKATATKEHGKTAEAQSATLRAPRQPKPKAAKAAPSVPRTYDNSTFNGTWANSYSDGIGGMVTDYLTLTFDAATGTAKGLFKDENGDGRPVSGQLHGNRLVMRYDADGDEFATISIINANTLKIEGFTGTFKRVQDMNSAPRVDIATPVTEAPVDPAYEEVKRYLEDK